MILCHFLFQGYVQMQMQLLMFGVGVVLAPTRLPLPQIVNENTNAKTSLRLLPGSPVIVVRMKRVALQLPPKIIPTPSA